MGRDSSSTCPGTRLHRTLPEKTLRPSSRDRHSPARIRRLSSIFKSDGTEVLFSIKSLAIPDALTVLAPEFDGYSVSSLFEARLARSVLGSRGRVHFVGPGMRDDQADELGRICDGVTLNSASQYRHSLADLPPRTNPPFLAGY